MITNAITKHITTYGNYDMVPRGQKLFDCPNCGKKGRKPKVFYNVAPGRLVAWTIDDATLQPITIDYTDLPNLAGKDIYLGVGYDADGDGLSEGIRRIAGTDGKIDKCMLDEAKVSAPVCGQPQILATYIDCVQCREEYAATFRYRDNYTQSFGISRNDWETITVSAQTDCCSCDDCSPEANCDEIICKLVDEFNNEVNYDINGKGYPDRVEYYPELPYRAVRLHDNWNTYCLSPLASECSCENCTGIDAIVSATIGGEVVEFTGNLSPTNNAVTNIAQLKGIAHQIECAFDEIIGPHSGFAFVTGGGPDSCCPAALHVVTCDDSFVLTGVSGDIDTCEAINPYPEFAKKMTCVDCGSSPSTPEDAPKCGLAIIIDQPTIDCDCYLNRPWAFYGRHGEFTFVKDANDCTPIVKAAELLAPKLPENFGSQIQFDEYNQDIGGDTRNYSEFNNRQGWLGLPDSTAKVRNAVTADCHKSYCQYFLGHSQEARSHNPRNNFPNLRRLSSYINIPSDDDVTLGSFEEFFNALLEAGSGNCKVIGPVTCEGYAPEVTP